jgi:hypothetical protein
VGEVDLQQANEEVGALLLATAGFVLLATAVGERSKMVRGGVAGAPGLLCAVGLGLIVVAQRVHQQIQRLRVHPALCVVWWGVGWCAPHGTKRPSRALALVGAVASSSSIIHHPSSIIHHHPSSIIHHPSSIIHHPSRQSSLRMMNCSPITERARKL